MPDSSRSLGTAEPVFLVLLLLAWVLMLITVSGWIGKSPVPGRETDRMMLQAWSGALALLVWIFLAAILLIAVSKNVLPAAWGAASWFVVPLSGLAALAAIAVMYDPRNRWPIAIPALIPPLIAGYVFAAFFGKIPIGKAGLAVFGFVVAISLSILPEAIRFAQTHLDDGSIEATPGPKLDAWLAKERERRRADGLEELRKSDDETKLYELEHLIRPDSPVLKEALDFMRHQPNRQAEAIQMLESQSSVILHFLGDIDLQPTPELCAAARGYLHRAVRERQAGTGSTGNTFVGAEFQEGIESIRWISKNCGCDAQLAEMEAYARAQDQTAPDVKKFLAALTEMKQARQ